VTGKVSGNFICYTADSILATAVVHAGVVKPGITTNVRIEMITLEPNVDGTFQNGVTS
jgi:hypothetical protein